MLTPSLPPSPRAQPLPQLPAPPAPSPPRCTSLLLTGPSPQASSASASSSMPSASAQRPHPALPSLPPCSSSESSFCTTYPPPTPYPVDLLLLPPELPICTLLHFQASPSPSLRGTTTALLQGHHVPFHQHFIPSPHLSQLHEVLQIKHFSAASALSPGAWIPDTHPTGTRKRPLRAELKQILLSATAPRSPEPDTLCHIKCPFTSRGKGRRLGSP